MTQAELIEEGGVVVARILKEHGETCDISALMAMAYMAGTASTASIISAQLESHFAIAKIKQVK